tara:strand:+ start:1501 stop:4212 length:2712 start_codon:yes stop_codon:yes gene_type:complete
MSVQLILHPQSYGGKFNTLSNSPTEAIVNGITFVNIDNTATYTTTSATPYVDTLTNAPPNIINTWYRFRKGSLAFPTSSVNNLVLEGGSSEITGVYQAMTNVTQGMIYIVTIDTQAVAGGTVTVGAYLGSSLINSNTYSSNTTQINFVIPNLPFANINIMISYSNASALDLNILNISAQPVIGQVPSTDPNIIDNGQVILDLYEDEDLPLTLSIDDFKNVAEKVQSYSKAFNLPATKRNNRIFDQVFEVTRSDDGVIFNVYKKTQCVLKQDGFILFEGYLRLLDVTDKDGEISYNVNLYSEVIALADFLKDLEFRDLDFTELTHEYNIDEIKNSWNDGVTAGQLTPITWTNPSTSTYRTNFNTLKYPFVDWNNQIRLSGIDPLPQLTSLETAFRPFISVKYLIDRIFQNSPFTYTSAFFNTTIAGGGAFDFDKLYMDFNWGSNDFALETEIGTYGGVSTTPLYSTTSYQTVPLDDENFSTNIGWDNTNNRFTATNNNSAYSIQWQLSGSVVSGMGNLTVRWAQYNSAGTFLQQYDFSSSTYAVGLAVPTVAGQIYVLLQSGDYLQLEFKTDVANKFVITLTSPSTYFLVTIGSLIATTNTFLQTLRGELGQWDFLKGLITMFNLVTLPDEDNPNNIVIEPYSDIFITNPNSVQLNWTEKIDVSEMKLTPLADLNKRTIFKFVEDDDDSAFTQYRDQVGGHLYGSKKYDAGNEFNILEGLDEVVAEPFAATVVKPLFSNFPQFITPSVYAYNSEDDTSEGFDNSPRIMYNNGIKSTGVTYFIPAQNNFASEDQPNFLQFSHLTSLPPGAIFGQRSDFHFGECQLMTGLGNATANNLFNVYWLPYYAQLYNPNTRTMTLKVNLSPADINTFKFNDTVMIKNRVFRVNKIDYKPNDLATVEFILIP